MQILVILFLGVFALGMMACVIKLMRDRDNLREDVYLLETDNRWKASEIHKFQAIAGVMSDALVEKTNDLTAAHKMLEMVLERDLENNQGFEVVRAELSDVTLNYQFNNKDDEFGVVEVSRSGVLYLFDKAERINYEGNRRADSKSSVASGDSSEQEAEVRPFVQDGHPLYLVE